MLPGAAPGQTARIETQAPEIPAPPDPLPDAPGALCAGSSTGNGAPVGRGVQHTSVPPPSLEDLAKRVREAVERGDFDLARELIASLTHRAPRVAFDREGSMPKICGNDHSTELPASFATLPESQAGRWRHTCAGCAYRFGRNEAAAAKERLRERVRKLEAELKQLKTSGK